jgi:hypothetical protein
MMGSSLNVWSSGGSFWTHSIEEFSPEVKRAGRLADILSQRINRKNMTAINEMKDPIEEMAFHVV